MSTFSQASSSPEKTPAYDQVVRDILQMVVDAKDDAMQAALKGFEQMHKDTIKLIHLLKEQNEKEIAKKVSLLKTLLATTPPAGSSSAQQAAQLISELCSSSVTTTPINSDYDKLKQQLAPHKTSSRYLSIANTLVNQFVDKILPSTDPSTQLSAKNSDASLSGQDSSARIFSAHLAYLGIYSTAQV